MVSACSIHGVAVRSLDDGSFREEIGCGVEGHVQGKLLEVGNKAWLHSRQSISDKSKASVLDDEEAHGPTVVSRFVDPTTYQH